ncbi:hypothetical protein [Breoghania sp. L-A4]|uniref:hypothetical protein n=1 Tax=Breoghania sp. L-A4 TaxID=2304600 RepID=UPI0013C321FD|nr:hypothetical protein [Breoghania sp. L-A4]
MLRLVVVLTNMGISAQIAVAHASLLQAKFDELYDKGKLDSSIVFISAQPDEDDEEDAYYMDGFDYQPVAVAMRTAEYGGRFPNGTAIVIDLITLMDEVLFQLDKLDAPESPPSPRKPIWSGWRATC